MRLPRIRLPKIDRADYSPTQIRDLWDDACTAVGLQASVGVGEAKRLELPHLGTAEQVIDGYYRFRVALPMGVVVRDLAKQAERLGSSLEASSLWVHPVDGMGGRRAIVSIDLRPLPTGPLLWEPPADRPGSLPDQVKIGETMLGQPVMFNIVGRRDFAPHLLVAGATGAGKTNLMSVIQASVLAGGGVAMYAVDPGEVDVARWVYAAEDMGRQVFARAAIDEADWLPLLHEVVARMRANRAWIRAQRRSSLFECRDIEGCPAAILLFLDELHRLLASEKAGGLVRELIREGRKYGVQIVAATQTTTHRDIPTDIRAQFAARSAGAMVNRTDGEVVLGEFSSSAPVHELPVNQGHAYLAIVGQRAAHHVRYCHLPDDMIPRVVHVFAPPLDPGQPGSTEPDQGEEPASGRHVRHDPPSRPPVSLRDVGSPEQQRHDPAGEPTTPSVEELEALVYGTSPEPTEEHTSIPDAPVRASSSRARQQHAPDHPLAATNGKVDVHRRIMFDRVEGRDEPCSSCGSPLEWMAAESTGRRIRVVFLDRDRRNEDPGNLAVMCRGCAGRHYGGKA